MIGEQLKLLRKDKNLNQTEFAESIGMSRIFIATIESGKNVPSERTIRDICQLYKVNRDWLVDGVGDMYKKLSQEEVITDFMADLLNDEDASFKKRLIEVLAGLPDDKWEWLESLALSLANKQD